MEGFIFAAEELIVWATERYEKTGVEPYVHERGVGVPSLRRLARKRPYFTNGTGDPVDVLERARFDGDGFWHASGPDAEILVAPCSFACCNAGDPTRRREDRKSSG